tara:strand:+ start:2727 stop:3044 length:318 start_codon:yes stop_codon:yes gene_type:complete
MSEQVVFFLTRLSSKEERDAYEEWVRKTDIPTALDLPGVESYRVVRLEGPVMDGVDAPSYDYIEIIGISDLDTYKSAIEGVDPGFLAQFTGFIGEFESVHGHLIE